MGQDRDKSTKNMRRYRQDNEKKLLALVLFTLVFVGGGLIALIFGPEALLTALPCLLAGAALMLGLWLLLSLGEMWLNRWEQADRKFLEASNDSKEKAEDGEMGDAAQ